MLMDRIFDFYDDPQGLILKVIEKETKVPELIKSANTEIGAAGRSSKTLFAWPDEKRFPMDTPEDIVMSHLYFEKTASHIHPSIRDTIADNLQRVADFMGVPLQSMEKTATARTEYEIETKDFAVSLPAKSLPDTFLEKYAHHVYQEHFVLYPLNSEENVKKANMMFPKGLDNELEFFRPFIAKDIANKLEAVPAPRVQEYLPIAKSAAIEQLEYRVAVFPDHSDKYQGLLDQLHQEDTNFAKFASALDSADTESGAKALYSRNFYGGMRYATGVVDDLPSHEMLEFNGRELPFTLLQKSASSLKPIYPNIEETLKDYGQSQEFFGNMSVAEKQLILQTVL
jgi:hypothetical protein